MDESSPLLNPRDMSPEAFLHALAAIPWFRQLGEPDALDVDATGIHDWHEWPGPESPEVDALGSRTQAWYDALMGGAGPRRQAAQALWDQTHQVVIEHARKAVPYDPEEDTWHGPTAAVWFAAWVSATIACSLLLCHDIPSEALDHWHWFIKGHWPCGYAWAPIDNEPVRLMVL